VTGVAGLPGRSVTCSGGGPSLGAVQVGMLQASSEQEIVPNLVAGTSVAY
jgi:NTE family protein